MSKIKMLCPISKTACIDCPIYRGRHFYMCFSDGYRAKTLVKDDLEKVVKELKSGLKASEDNVEVGSKILDEIFSIDLKCIHNVEDIVLEKELEK